VLGGVRLGQVRRDDRHLDAIPVAELLGQGIEPVPSACHQHQVMLLGGVAAGELLADPRRRTGDESDHGSSSCSGEWACGDETTWAAPPPAV